MKKLLFAASAALMIAASSCSEGGPFPGFEKTTPSTYFKLHKAGTGKDTAGVGGVAFVQMAMIDGMDSVIQDFNAARGQGSVPIRFETPRFKGDFLDVISHMHMGDSATFFVNLDTIKKYFRKERDEFPLEPKYDSLKYIGFRVKVDSVYTKAFTEKKIKEMQDKQEKMFAEMKNAAEGKIQDYLTKNKLTDLKPDAKGIYYKELKAGTTPIKPGMRVGARYKGTLTDGTVFDSNTGDPKAPLMEFTAGDQMIPGFTDCILRMKDGGKALFILPPDQAYGAQSQGAITPFSPLVFEVEIKIIDAKTGK